MATVVHLDNDDENSVIEIEAPKKPAPLVIDLADEEILINVKSDIPNTPLSPGVPWVSQYDNRGNFGGGGGEGCLVDLYKLDDDENKENINIEERNNRIVQEENDDVVEEEEGGNEEENDEVTEDENDETDEEVEDENGENDEAIKNEKEESEEENEDENKENEDPIKDEKEEAGVVIEAEIRGNGDVINEDDIAVGGLIDIMNRGDRGSPDNEISDEDNGENDERRDQDKLDKKTDAGNNRRDGNGGDKQGEEKKDETGQGDGGKQDDQGKDDNQNQPGPSNSDPQGSYTQGSYSLASFSQASFSQASFPQASFSQASSSQSPFCRLPFSRPPYLHDPYTVMSANPPRADDPGPHHPDHWTPEMVKFYDEDWGNEKEFVVEKLQEAMDKDPSLWQISSRDVGDWKNKDNKPTVRCYNCFDCGHESYDCPEEERVPKCHMCGVPGHIAYKCPDSLCLNCGTATTGYVTKCKNCTFGLDKVCERCNLTGHIYSECTDHWRLYHSTIGTKRVDQPKHDIYKPIRNRWCCNCGRQGHLQVECDYCVKNCEFSDTLPFVTSYIKAFTRGSQLAYGYEEPDGPKRIKINAEDNIMTNPSQKHVYQRKTSQLKNKLKSLAREAMMRSRERTIDRRRHPEGGFNRFSFF